MTNSRDSRRNRRSGRGGREMNSTPQAANEAVVLPMEFPGKVGITDAQSSLATEVSACVEVVSTPANSLAMVLPSPARSSRAMFSKEAGHETLDSSGTHRGHQRGGYGMNQFFAGSQVAGQGAFHNGAGSHSGAGGRFDGSGCNNDRRTTTAHVVPPRRVPEPWDLPSSAAGCDPSAQQEGMSSYRDHLRTSGQQALQRTWNRGVVQSSQAATGTVMPMSHAGGVQLPLGGEMLPGCSTTQLPVDAQSMQIGSGMQGTPTHMGQWNPPMDAQFWAGALPMCMPQMMPEGCQQIPTLMPDNGSHMVNMMMPDNCQQTLSMMSSMQTIAQDSRQQVPTAIPDNSPHNQQSQLMNILMPAGCSMDNAQIVAELQAAAQCEYED